MKVGGNEQPEYTDLEHLCKSSICLTLGINTVEGLVLTKCYDKYQSKYLQSIKLGLLTLFIQLGSVKQCSL